MPEARVTPPNPAIPNDETIGRRTDVVTTALAPSDAGGTRVASISRALPGFGPGLSWQVVPCS